MRKYRQKAGIRYRDRKQEDKDERKALTEAVVQQEMRGSARRYGRELMATRLQQTMPVRQRHVRQALQTVHLKEGSARPFLKSEGKPRKKTVEFNGPDWMWSLDGHDKFTAFGIEIYAAVDVVILRPPFVRRQNQS